MVLDSQTNLEWQDSYEEKVAILKWDEAVAYCEGLALGGKKDWRLPEVKELSSIADTSKVDPSIVDGFDHTVAFGYWTSSENEANEKEALTVFFDYAYESTSPKNEAQYVRCVRG